VSASRVSTTGRVGQYAALAAYCAFLGFPLLWLLSTAFKSTKEIALGATSLIPSSFTWSNFSEAVDRAHLVTAGSPSPPRCSRSCSPCRRPTGWPGSAPSSSR
jgi:multiple sugar transport system permease protein